LLSPNRIGAHTAPGKAGLAPPYEPFYVIATIDTIHVFVPEAREKDSKKPGTWWYETSTEITRLYGRRPRMTYLRRKLRGRLVTLGATVKLQQPTRQLLNYLASLAVPLPSPRGPRHAKYRVVLSRVDVAVDYWFETEQQLEAFVRFLRIQLGVKWKLLTVARDEGRYAFYMSNWSKRAQELGKDKVERPPREVLVYDLIRRHGRAEIARRLGHIQTAHFKIPPEVRCLSVFPDAQIHHAVRLELSFSEPRVIKRNGITLRAFDQIDLAQLFDHNLCLLKARPRLLRRMFKRQKDWSHGWKRPLYHRLIDPRFLLSLPLSSILPVPRLSIPD
jgi:hypothetical protein